MIDYEYLLTNVKEPSVSLIISEDTKDVLEAICNVEIDSLGSKCYIVNDLKLKVEPYVDE